MVQIGDPKSLRKELLEALRDVIIFMQGYEQFIRIQEEKVAVFTALKSSVKELNALIDVDLRKYFPRGELQPLKMLRPGSGLQGLPPLPKEEEEPLEEEAPAEEKRERAPERKPKSDLDLLESQLKDIEKQLQKIQ